MIFKQFKLYLTLGLLAAIAIGVAYHFWTVNGLQSRNNSLTIENQSLNQRVTVMEEAAKINEATIESLNNNIREQVATIEDLTNVNNRIERERDEYLSIFRRHDLTDLARRRPGLIEPRINSGTVDVFDSVEEVTRQNENN